MPSETDPAIALAREPSDTRGAMSEEAKKVIDGALELLADEYNWSPRGVGRTRWADDGGQRCTMQALVHSTHRAGFSIVGDEFRRAKYAVYAAIGIDPIEERVAMPLGMWNDTPGRTHAEVLDVLRKAREIA